MRLSKSIIIIGFTIILSLLLVNFSGYNKGWEAFLTIPLLLLLNGGLSLYGFITKQKVIGITGLVLFFVTPIMAFIIFIRAFQFLTR